MRIGVVLLMLALFALLGGALWFAFGVWAAVDLTDMPGWAYGAMAGGIIFSLLVGCGLMALVFYSSRHGYDDRASGNEFDRQS